MLVTGTIDPLSQLHTKLIGVNGSSNESTHHGSLNNGDTNSNSHDNSLNLGRDTDGINTVNSQPHSDENNAGINDIDVVENNSGYGDDYVSDENNAQVSENYIEHIGDDGILQGSQNSNESFHKEGLGIEGSIEHLNDSVGCHEEGPGIESSSEYLNDFVGGLNVHELNAVQFGGLDGDQILPQELDFE